jgi:hypothetical protein
MGMYLARGARYWGDRPAILFRERQNGHRAAKEVVAVRVYTTSLRVGPSS